MSTSDHLRPSVRGRSSLRRVCTCDGSCARKKKRADRVVAVISELSGDWSVGRRETSANSRTTCKR